MYGNNINIVQKFKMLVYSKIGMHHLIKLCPKFLRRSKSTQKFEIICHDLKSYMRSLNLFIDYLSVDKTRLISENNEEIFSCIKTNIKHMYFMLEEMEYLHRPEPMMLNKQLDMVNFLKNEITPLYTQDKSAAFSLKNLHPLKIKREDGVKIFRNLIENAIKYSDESSVINIRSRSNYFGVLYSVKDNGFGISKENREVIFNYKTRASLQGGEGRGIGLFLIRTIMQKYKGKIWVKSEPKNGSTFYLFFPH